MTALRSALRRGWCPGALKPMETGDGWLVRIHPRGGRLTVEDLRLLARQARATGNGLVDITARGNLQLRGIRPESHADLVAALIEGGLADAEEGDGPLRLTVISPLAGRDPTDLIDAAALAEAVETAGRSLPGLPAKTSVVVDGGGALSLDDIAGDLKLRAVSPGAMAICLPDGRWLAPMPVPAVVDATSAFLALLAAHHRADPVSIRRLRDVPREVIDAAVTHFRLSVAGSPLVRPAVARAGLVAEIGGTYALIAGAPFGRLDAVTLTALAATAETFHAADIRLSPWRGVALTGLADGAAACRAVAALGLIVDPADPRLSVHACPGAPACSRGESPAQADAAQFAAAAARHLEAGLTLHVSGCIKGCARPGIADVTLVGHEGAYGVVLGGTATDKQLYRLPAADITARLAAPGDLRANLLRTDLR
jgi:precorrin-3B synthase